MTDKKTKTTDAPTNTTAAPPAATSLETRGNTGLAEVPSWFPEGDTTGTEMAIEDIRLPRLAIAQGLSPQLIPDNAVYIDGLRMFELFNDLSGEIYGRGPLTFVCVRHDVKYIQFKPRSEGGGLLDANVPPNDPRTRWTTDPNDPTKRLPPLATKFNEYVVMLAREDGLEPIVLSIKDTNKENRRAATNLNGFISMPTKIGMRRIQLPIYGKKYTIESGTGKNDKGTYGVPIIKQAGILSDGDIGRQVLAFAEKIKDKNIEINREPGVDDDEVEFNPEELERQGSATSEM